MLVVAGNLKKKNAGV